MKVKPILPNPKHKKQLESL